MFAFRLGRPEAAGDILPGVVVSVLVEPLVGRGLVKRTEVLEIGTDLDVVEVILVHLQWNAHPATVPCDLQVRIFLMDVLCQTVDAPWLSIATHEGDTSDVLAVLLDELVNGVGRKRHTDVLPKILRMAAWAAAGTTRDVDGKGHLIRNLLKDNACVNVFQHGEN